MKRRWLLFALLVLVSACVRIDIRIPTPRAAVDRIAGPPGTPGATTNPCTDAQPCTPKKAMQDLICSAGDRVILLSGTYTGDDYMMTPGDYVPGKSGTSGAKCIVQARTDGGPFFNGEGLRRPVYLQENSHWTFQGFDAGNARGATGTWSPANSQNGGASVVEFYSTSGLRGLEFKRICAFNASPYIVNTTTAQYSNNHVWAINYVVDSLFEDICGFGTGRNMILEYGNEFMGGTIGNRFRRGWFRWEGWPYPSSEPGCGGGVTQAGYHSDGRAIWENLIEVYDGQQAVPGDAGWGRCYKTAGQDPVQQSIGTLRAVANRDPTIETPPGNGTGDRWFGRIVYGTGTHMNGITQPHNASWVGMKTGTDVNQNPTSREDTYTDSFVDGRTQPVPPFDVGCLKPTCLNRITAIKDPTLHGGGGAINGTGNVYYHVTNDSWYQNTTPTNFNECTTLGACPNIYTGTSPGTGSRACFEYTNGVLGSTAATQGLWPWRMDDRIKQALARARATAPSGASPLAGGAGAGYAAGTVTSEIVSRYGPIPAGCSRTTTAFAPSFPIVSDFPSTLVLDDFDRANGPIGANWTTTLGTPFIIQSNVAKAPAGDFARMLWLAGTFVGPHEVHATWPTMPAVGYDGTMLVFAGTAGSDLGQYRVYLARPASGNTTLRILKIDAGGAATTILSPIDLGTDIGDTAQSLGVRVNATQTINLYWKWTDNQWYRVGSVIDPTLPATNAAIGFAGSEAMTVNNFGGGTCCGGATPSPGAMGRFGNLFPKQ